jgi:hypothetical protein
MILSYLGSWLVHIHICTYTAYIYTYKLTSILWQWLQRSPQGLLTCQCMYVCMYVCTYTYIIYVYMYIYMYVRICMYAYVCSGFRHLKVRSCICIYTYIYIYIYKHTHICMYVCIYIYIYIYVHTYLHVCMHTCMYLYVCMYLRGYMCKSVPASLDRGCFFSVCFVHVHVHRVSCMYAVHKAYSVYVCVLSVFLSCRRTGAGPKPTACIYA